MTIVARESRRLHGLDTLRSVAILGVMAYHLNGHLPDALQGTSHFGWMGVDLFFVLSGFLIGWQLFRPYLDGKPPSILAFYRRRAYRILPAFFVVLLLYLFVPMWREAPGLQTWWQFATFTENLLIDYGKNQAFSHAWSLCVEEHFYLLCPLLTLLLMRRPNVNKTAAVLISLSALGIAVRASVLLHQLRPLAGEDGFGTAVIEKLYYPTYVRLDGLLAGVSLAALRAFRPRAWCALMRHGHLLTITGMCVLAFTTWCTATRFTSVTGKAVAGDLFGYPLLGLGFGLLTASAVSDNGLLAQFRIPGAKTLATLAFALYLTHKAAVHLLFQAFPALPDNTWLAQAVMFAACLLVALPLHLLVERPFLRLREQRDGRRVTDASLRLQARIDPAV